MSNYVVSNDRFRQTVEMKKIYLGSGSQTQTKRDQGFVTVDFDARYKPDVLWNLDEHPYPFNDNSIDYIEAFHVIEHLTDVDAFMQDLWRICKHDAKIKLMYPHISRVMATGFGPKDKHRTAIPMRLLDRYSVGEGFKEEWKFTYESIRFEWLRSDVPPHPKAKHKGKWYAEALNGFISWLGNINITATDRVLAYWFGGFDNIILECRVNKQVSWAKPMQRDVEKRSVQYSASF